MKRSTERFLTTHTGSLPRPEDLIRTMYAKEEGVPVDPAALAARVRAAVAEVVKKIPGDRLGIHTHNDTENAVANTLAAVRAGVLLTSGNLRILDTEISAAGFGLATDPNSTVQATRVNTRNCLLGIRILGNGNLVRCHVTSEQPGIEPLSLQHCGGFNVSARPTPQPSTPAAAPPPSPPASPARA